MNLYKEELLEHYKNPQNYGKIEQPDIATEEYNPSCGDSIELTISLKNDFVSDIKFTGKGCVISQASASMLTSKCKGLKIDQIGQFNQAFMLNLLGIDLGPNRLKCAMLCLYAVHKGLSEYSSSSSHRDTRFASDFDKASPDKQDDL